MEKECNESEDTLMQFAGKRLEYGGSNQGRRNIHMESERTLSKNGNINISMIMDTGQWAK